MPQYHRAHEKRRYVALRRGAATWACHVGPRRTLPLTSVAAIMRNSPILSLCSPFTGVPSTSIVRAPIAAHLTFGAGCNFSPGVERSHGGYMAVTWRSHGGYITVTRRVQLLAWTGRGLARA